MDDVAVDRWRRYELPGGWTVLAGRTDEDNDYLSLKLASANDWWFHAHGCPGSHVLLRARAIENQCAVIGVNRTGTGGGIAYDGGSAAYDAWGEALPVAEGCPVAVVTVDAAAVADIRERYPFLRDRSRT